MNLRTMHRLPLLAVTGILLLGAHLRAADFSGRVTDGSVGLSGLTISYSWSSPVASGNGSVTTNSSGNWSSPGWGPLTNITFNRPVQAGYTFSPTSRPVSTNVVGGGSLGGLNFTRTSYNISGTITRGGVALPGVSVSLTGAMTASTTTNASGNYSFVRLRTGNYTITPSRPGTVFSPANRATTLAPSSTSQNFSADLPTVITLPATHTALGNATLTGSMEGDGINETTAFFEFGTGGNLTAVDPPQVFAPGTSPTLVSAPVSSLAAGVIYDFRLVASNVSGLNQGSIQSFQMPYPAAGNALSLPGNSASFVNGGTASALQVTTHLTMEAWIHPTGPGGGGVNGGAIMSREGEYLLSRFADGSIRYAIANTTPGWNFVNTGVVVPLNQWAHLAFTYHSTNGQIRLYLNGVEAYAAAGTGPIGDAITTQNEFRIGSRQGATTQVFHGQIDEVRVWSITRTASEILDHVRKPLAGTETGLLAYFNFNEGGGPSVANSVPASQPGTLAGQATLVLSGAPMTAPLVTTLEASPVLATRATLRASANPSGSPTLVRFEYGETLAYGTTTEGQDIGEGIGNIALESMIIGLQPGTTYHYRSVVENTFGTTYGGNQTFTTLVLGVGWPTTPKVTSGFSSSPKHIVDAAGNAYLAGNFTGSATLKSTMVSQHGTPDAFIGKLGRGADWLWNNPLVTTGGLTVHAIALDAARNVHVAGEFSGVATFGTIELTATGAADLFVAKLDADGAWLWANKVGAVADDSANALAVNPAGEIFVAGHFGGNASFGTHALVASGNRDLFVAKLDAAGDWLWAQGTGGSSDGDSAKAIVLNPNGDAILTGQFQGTASFGLVPALISAGDTDLFVARISTGGQWLSAQRGGGAGADSGSGLAIDPAGSVYLLGKFAATANYGSFPPLNEGSTPRLFVAKLKSDNTPLWYSQAGPGNAGGISVDANGRVYTTGDFTTSTSFVSSTNPTLTLISSGGSDIFVTRMNSDSGDWEWAEKIGSTGAELSGSVGVDAQGGIVFSGTFQGTVPLGYVLLSTPNERDIFIARLNPDAVFEHNNYQIGQAIPVPFEAQDPDRTDGGAIAQPLITILDKEHPDSVAVNSFVWSLSERKLYAVRPVTAVLKWPLTSDPANTTSVATAVGTSVWPDNPQIHVAGAPVELEPAVAGFPYRYLNLSFTTSTGASVDSTSKQLTAAQAGRTVIQFLDTGGELPNPTLHPSRFEVILTVPWHSQDHLVDNQAATIGTALTHPDHNDPTGKNGYVLFERSFFDGAGEDRAHDRNTRGGPILPVNRDTSAADDDLVVIWYRTNLNTGIAWPSLPVRYQAQWPGSPDQLVLASGIGSGTLPAANFPDKHVYNQPDPLLPGFNPNEEHAALYGDVLHALRSDLNNSVNPKASDPYTMLKYRDPMTNLWSLKVFHVVTTTPAHQFTYSGEAGALLDPPAPLSILPICGANTWIFGPGFKDHLGRLHARAAGQGGTGATIVTRYWYPLQPGFFYDINRDGQPDAPVGDCIPWLDRRPGGTLGTPVDITYNITWPADVPTLQIGETLLGAKFELPDLRNFAHAKVIFDEGDPEGVDGISSLVRLFDPLAARTLQLRPNGATNFLTGPGYGVFRVADPTVLFAGLATANDAGLTVFTDLPFTLRSRLRYDALNKNLIFRGLLDESQNYGGEDNPLLLINILSPRERDRLKQLNGSPAFSDLIDTLYELTRNPNRLDLDGDNLPDEALLVGLVKNGDGDAVPEVLGDGPKVLTAGNARASGFVTLVENNDPALGGLPVTLHVIRVDDGPYRGDIKVVQSDNVFDEKLTLRHSADFGGEPQNYDFEWYYRPVEAGTDPSSFPTLQPDGDIADLRGWIQYFGTPSNPEGLNDITLGDAGTSSLLVLADNYFICRHRGYVINGETNWSDWVGVIGGGQAQLAEGWVKRVRDGLNPFEARSKDFHANETVTFASMLQQAGTRYEGPIAFNPGGGNINSIGLIEAYQTVLDRAKNLSIEGLPEINYQPANDALLLAAGFIADLYFLLGNEAVADAADPTIGFRTSSAGYGTLAPSIFAFQNQLDSLLEEELTLLRGRDDSSATVRLPPVYNRLFWNFTRDEGEVAYAQAYNITDQNGDGFIDATDARIMYPQSHGDAWGHYLTATKTYYGLLQNPNFDWIPRSEPILLAGVPVNVDYLDERKFARAAAAKAKVGAEVVDLTYRLNYVDDPNGQYQGYRDTQPDRAWGVSEWAHRAGTAALFDWVTANAVLPSVDANPDHVGIEKIDRTTVSELSEIIAGYASVQSQVDKADAGLNPLGLAKNVVPFDIDPSLISSGKTHFEQIYDRALDAVNNTVTVFDHANQLSQALRAQQDSVNDFSRNAQQQERDYKNRMIEIFGYPYAGDIGPGRTYPTGYDGPDIYHYMYVNTIELSGDTAPPSETFTGFFAQAQFGLDLSPDVRGKDFYFPDDVPGDPGDRLTNPTLEVSYPTTAADYGFTAPASWGQRRAPGQIQMALSNMVQSQARYKQALLNYDNLILRIDDSIELLQARYNLQGDKVRIHRQQSAALVTLSAAAFAAKTTSTSFETAKAYIDDSTGAVKDGLPKVVGTASDVFAPARLALSLTKNMSTAALTYGKVLADNVAEGAKDAKDTAKDVAAWQVQKAEFEYEIQQKLAEIEELFRQEAQLRVEAFAQREALTQSLGGYQTALAQGLRLADERIAFRKNAAADTQASRYQDMTFRIFRNDAIQKYRSQFDLAAQYVFLAAVAYDYETQLLGNRPGAGRALLTDIVKQRALGEVVNGEPVAGRHGLADPLARLNQNFGVLKGQLGFNNPQTETGRFSLRKEMLRLRDPSDEEWRAELKKNITPNLWDIPEFRRYCRPFAPESAGPQPGLVLRFPTTVTFGLNYFGWPLGGGDSSYDSTLFATKVRSAGVWFSDYNGSGLSITPRVYLVPVGADVMRSPSGNNLETREWRVVDQKIPVPFPIGFSSLNNPAWIPMNDSLSDTFADIRRFSSFRAYHDSGVFDPAETASDSRLIGRSVWNTDWMLIIPGGTFLFDSNQGLETFINTVGDIKIFYQTYAYSGN